MKLGALCEEIKRILDGQQVAPDSKFTLREIALHVNQAIAEIVKNSFLENSQADGLMYANDQFMLTCKGVDVVDGVCAVPADVIGLPRMRGFMSVRNSEGTGSEFIPVLLKDWFLHEDMPSIKGRTLYCVIGKTMKFKGTVSSKVDMVLLAPAYTDLDTDIDISGEVKAQVIKGVLTVLASMVGRQEDNTNDGVNKVS